MRPPYPSAMLRILASLQCWCCILSAAAAAAASHERAHSAGAEVDGLGLAYAESCQAKLFAYRNASLANYATQPTRTSYYTNTIVRQSFAPGTTTAASLTTLCDGHPRVVGHAVRTQGDATNITEVYTNTNYYKPTAGTAFTPPPCSIGPKDCELLWSSWTQAYSTASAAVSGAPAVRLSPPCTTSVSSASYSTNSAGKTCDNCQVGGKKARLLYWPVTTVPGSGDLCNKTGITVPATRTAEGPVTFVTDGVTITSPTVAVSIAGLSRVDGCGTTIATTIIPVRPEEVSSVRGNRALFEHYPFNFADLNWHCPDGEFPTDDGHHNCYQEVPAAAYFDGTEKWAGLDAMNVDWKTQKNLTIFNDYHPQLLPPKTMEDAVHSIWGKDCNIHPNGVWDPPIALQKADAVEVPVNTPAAPAQAPQAPEASPAPRTYTAEYATQTMDGGDNAGHAPTALPNVHPDANAPYVPSPGPTGEPYAGHGQPDSSGQTSNAGQVSGPGHNGGSGQGSQASGQAQDGGSGQGGQGSGPGHDAGSGQAGQASGPDHNAGSEQGGQASGPNYNGGSAQGAPPSGQVVVIHSVTFTRQIQSNGADVWTNAQTHFTVPKGTAGSPPVVVVSQETYTVSAGLHGGTGPGSASGASYYLIGDGTTYGIEYAQPTSPGAVRTQSGSATADKSTGKASDGNLVPTSASSAGSTATTRDSSKSSQPSASPSSAATSVHTSESILSAVLSIIAIIAWQVG